MLCAQKDVNSLPCFLQLEGSINDCSCEVNTVDHFNNIKIFPRLSSLLVKNYFRFYKVNLHRKCPFWPDDSQCAMRSCQVENCEEKNIPKGLIESNEDHFMKTPGFKVGLFKLINFEFHNDLMHHFNYFFFVGVL